MSQQSQQNQPPQQQEGHGEEGKMRPQQKFENITDEQLQQTFQTNIFAMFSLVMAALPHLMSGSAIVNTASVTAYQGSPDLVDYASTKGAIVAFTPRSPNRWWSGASA
jgi:NAD(P)-dependent dehydrogenase (short-subunit alcohol dehydrogenase family)